MSLQQQRSFEFREGTSDKFWTIELDGSSHSVRFGRTGTAGQEQTKTFSSEQTALASYEKLIAEKLKKGYREAGAPVPFSEPPAPKQPAAVKQPEVVKSDLRNPVGLHLELEDWLFATWRPREIQRRPAAPAFAVGDGLKRFERFLRKAKHDRPWVEARMPAAMAPEEARFWLGAMLAIAKQ